MVIYSPNIETFKQKYEWARDEPDTFEMLVTAMAPLGAVFGVCLGMVIIKKGRR